MKKCAGKRKNQASGSQNHPKISDEALNEGIEELCRKLKITEKDLLEQLKRGEKQAKIPVSIFSNEKLSGFELICKYLIENLGMQMSEAAKLLKRDYQTIWTEYQHSKKKHKGRLAVPASKYFFPISALANRDFSVLEAIAVFMKEELGLKFVEIARELHRDPRNIWTVYKRANAKNKRKQNGESASSLNDGIEELCRKLKITEKDLLEQLKRRKKQAQIPVSIFSNEKLSGFELICKYLIENLGMQISEAARLLNRDYGTIWTEYQNSKKKQTRRLSVPVSKYFFPITAIANRNLSVLESIVIFMKENLGLKFIEIARELHRDPRNIWTVHKRAKVKCKK